MNDTPPEVAETDEHCAAAADIFGVDSDAVSAEQRRIGKAVNLAVIYGMSAPTISRYLGIDCAGVQSYIDRYFERYPGVRAHIVMQVHDELVFKVVRGDAEDRYHNTNLRSE